MSLSRTDAIFEAEIRMRMAGVAICSACEDEWVPIPDIEDGSPVYCKWCSAFDRELKKMYAERASELFAAQPRELAGVVPMEQVAAPLPVAKLGGKEVLMACALYVAPGIAVGLVAAWFVLRVICQAGIALASAVAR